MNKIKLIDAKIAQEMKKALANPKMRKPSLETFLHVLCIHEAAAKWVGHTHSISVMSILCSKNGGEPYLHQIYPDEIVGCGEMPAVVPYADPGLPLACAARDELRRYLDKYGVEPKLILMVNHGMVAIGQSPKDVLTVSLTTDKLACPFIRIFSMDGPQYLSNQQVKRIETRPDEAYRRTQLTTIS